MPGGRGERPAATGRCLTGLVGALVLSACLGSITPAVAEPRSPDRVLVRFQPDVDRVEKVTARRQVEARWLESFDLVPGLQLIEVAGRSGQAAAELRELPEVRYALAEPIRQIETPDDPYFFPELWGLSSTGQSFTDGVTSYTALADNDINAPEAWDLSTGSRASTVAVIDTGIDLDHPDLIDNLWVNPGEVPGNGIDDDGNGLIDDLHGYDFVNDDPQPDDDQGHGTHVAGTIGARGNNGQGVVGVNWEVSLAALKACDDFGNCPMSATIAALDYAVAQGIPISNNSYGGCCNEYLPEKEALSAARAAGHLFVAAAGNGAANNDDPTQSSYPASYDLDNIISVAALSPNGAKASFSNYGATGVDLGAPGSQILSSHNDGEYSWRSGTSMAAPQVAGAAGLLRARRPDFDAPELRSRILSTAQPTPSLIGLVATDGSLDAGQALLVAPAAPTLTAGPEAVTLSSAAQFEFIGEPGAQVSCRLDDQPWEPCSSPVEYSELALGPKRFEVRQEKPTGMVGAEGFWEWTVETEELPVPEITSSPPEIARIRRAVFAFSSPPPGEYSCRLDDRPWEPCSSPVDYPLLTDGPHSFAVRQDDRQWSRSLPALFTWEVDTSRPPKPVLLQSPPRFSALKEAEITFSGVTDLYCQGEPCASPLLLSDLDEGPQSIEITQSYPGGGPTSEPLNVYWTVDSRAPEINVARVRKLRGRGRYVLDIQVSDFTGAAEMLVRGEGRERAMPYRSVSRVRFGFAPRWVAIIDQVGNRSWARLTRR
jgi:subtilisin family serine protease